MTENSLAVDADSAEDWCQHRATSRLVSLSAALIESAIEEAMEDIEALTQSFLEVAEKTQSLDGVARSLIEDAERVSMDELMAHSQIINREVHNAVGKLQLCDRLAQRLGNVRNNLSELAALLSESSQLHSAERWQGFLQRIRSQYTMEEERLMFDDVHAEKEGVVNAATGTQRAGVQPLIELFEAGSQT